MNNLEFVEKLKMAHSKKTLYVTGGLGDPLNSSKKNYFINTYKDNQTVARKTLIQNATEDTFAFDCSGLVKAIIWGWVADKNQYRGGAIYEANGYKDYSTEEMINNCYDVSTDFSKLEIGELLHISGHVGIVISTNPAIAIECTPKWSGCVQYTSINCNVKGYNRRDWTKHGKIKVINYIKSVDNSVDNVDKCSIELPVIRKGVKGEAVKTIQRLLISKGFSCGKFGIDGSAGNDTINAIKNFQKSTGITVDGWVGKETWNKILKG